jgi:hypothetical protein
MWWTGTPPDSNACWNHFGYVKMVHGGTRHGLVRGYDDNNHVDNLVAFRDSGTGKGVIADIAEASDFPRDDTFDKMSAGAGGFVIPAGAGYTARINHYSTSNGEPVPVNNDRPLAYGNGDCQQFARSFSAQGVDVNQLGTIEIKTSDYGSTSRKFAIVQNEAGQTGTTCGINNAGVIQMLFQNAEAVLMRCNGASGWYWATSDVVRAILALGLSVGNGTDPGLGRISCTKGFQPPTLADVDAAINTIYYSSDISSLAYKDSGGIVKALY